MLRHINCRAIPKEFFGCSTLKMDAAHYPKTLVNINQSTYCTRLANSATPLREREFQIPQIIAHSYTPPPPPPLLPLPLCRPRLPPPLLLTEHGSHGMIRTLVFMIHVCISIGRPQFCSHSPMYNLRSSKEKYRN